MNIKGNLTFVGTGLELRNVVIERLPADPSTSEQARIYYNTTENVFKYFNNTSWVELGSASQSSSVNGVTIKGGIDATLSPNYPNAVSGDAYYITQSGFIGGGTGVPVADGDMAICISNTISGDDQTVGVNWIILERNIDIATSSTSGLVRISTSLENFNGNSSTSVPTVAGVQEMIDNTGQNQVSTYYEELPTGTSSATISHNLGGLVMIQSYNKTTNQYVTPDYTRFDDDQIIVDFTPSTTAPHIVLITFIGIL